MANVSSSLISHCAILPMDTRILAPSPPHGERSSPNSVYSSQAWFEERDFHLRTLGTFGPTVPRTHRYVTASSAFKPLSMHGVTNTIPRMMTLDYRKHSPALSRHTSTTMDTFDRISSLDSPSTTSSRKGFMPVWIPPRDESICRVLEKSFDAAQRRSPMSDHSTHSAYSSKRSPKTVREEDPVRKSRLKTEMCMHYENGSNCPFGANCTYAHGEEELQMTKLIDLHRAGLVDLDTYRIKPCLTWISTGSCPFGKRCNSIHDPRAAGTQQSWLPHTETQGNTIATDINVEAMHQKRLHAINCNNPFGELFNVDLDDWEDLYNLICNIPTTVYRNRRRTNLAEHHKLSIALQTRGTAGWHYKFRPQHIILDELCMVLQKRAFRLTDSDAIEIPLGVYNSNRFSNQVLVREIAFGPDCDPTVRGVSLWFDIADKDVTVCTPQQAKRYRWKKGIKNHESPSTSLSKPKSFAFESRDSFLVMRPLVKDAYDLSTEILAHYLGMLRSERIANLRDRSAALSALQVTSDLLKARFDNLKRHWQTWAWPINDGRSKVDEKTPVPPVDGKYKPTSQVADEDGVGNIRPVERIWESFVASADHGGEDTPHDANQTSRRLPIFQRLANGSSTSANGSFPHITNRDMSNNENDITSDSERCWKALLLTPAYPFYEANEWKAVRDHFQNSRSKKVLSILQQ